jgi:AcrR family transcriptional regulator
MAHLEEHKANQTSEKSVRDRLLDTAEELFCEHGFAGTSIRDIAAAAGCNIASVNYHFGSKDNLYLEVWRRHLFLMREIRISSIDNVMSRENGPPQLEDLLSAFADSYIGPLMDESKGSRFIKLMAREMIDRRLPEDIFVKELIVPITTAFRGALLSVCPQLDRSKVVLVILSFIGQLMHVLHVKVMFEQTGEPEILKFNLNEAIDHIVKFSVAGIRACVEEGI